MSKNIVDIACDGATVSTLVDGAHVLDPDVEASNRLIHAIDRVLLPAQL